jgi:hypothetical protein
MEAQIAALRAMTNRQLLALGERLGDGGCIPPAIPPRQRLVERFQSEQDLTVDGWPGDRTYYQLWSCGYRPTTQSVIIQIARSWCAIGTKYVLGAGGYQWLADWPAAELDCSGFVATVLGRSRKPQPDFPWWLSTDSVWDDCADKQRLFAEIDGPTPGCIVVYPDAGGHQGHVAFVTEVEGEKIRGIDCSSSSSRKGDAIQERDISFFLAKSGVRFCVPNWLQG